MPALSFFLGDSTWTPKVCKIMAFMAVNMGLGLLFYILMGFRYYLWGKLSGKPEALI